MDSRCSRHLSGEKELFQEVTLKDYGSVTFRDNSNAKVISYRSIRQVNSTQVEKVLLIQRLKHNLLSIS